MRAQDRPITRQIVKVVHDDGNEQVDDLKETEPVGVCLVTVCVLVFLSLGSLN